MESHGQMAQANCAAKFYDWCGAVGLVLLYMLFQYMDAKG
jgi:hypothetical protein